jgi:flagellar hook-associated protein 3 FlgL
MPSADFRITHGGAARLVLSNLQTNQRRLADLQDQVSSMKQLRRPSDSPVGAVSALSLRSQLGRSDQIGRNIDDALSWLAVADSALQSVVDQIQRVKELVLTARNAATDSTGREAIANEIEKLRDTIVGLGNARNGERAVFAGTALGDAYDSSGNYTGVSAAVERTIAPGVRVQVNVNGDEVFGPAGSDLFTLLGQIAQSVRTDPGQLEAQTAALDARTKVVQTKLAEIGARYKRMETMKDRNDSTALTMKQQLSAVEDVDLPKAIMELQLQSVAYQTALSATARVIQPSLVDFLR